MSSMKQKEQKLEQDFDKLMDRYNRSKKLIDTLYTSKGSNSRETPFDTNSTKPQKEYRDLKLEATIEPQVGKKDKYQTLKQYNKELKATLSEFVNKPGEESKDHIMKQYERELSDAQHSLVKAMHDLKDYSLKEDSYKRQIELMQDEMDMMKTKMLKKKQKVQLLKQLKHRDNLQLDESTSMFNKELQRVQMLCEEFSLEIKETDKKNILLREEAIQAREELKSSHQKVKFLEQNIKDFKQKEQTIQDNLEIEREENRLLCMKVEQLERKIDELKDVLATGEQKNAKLKEKSDSEKQALLLSNEERLKAKKYKLKQLKEQISELEIRNINYDKDSSRTKKQLEENEAEILKLRQLLQNNKHDQENLLRENSLQMDKLKQLEAEKESLKKHLLGLEDKLKYEADCKLQEHRNNQSMQQEVEDLCNDNGRLKQIIYELENQIELLKRSESEEMGHIELKVDGLVREVSLLREENTELRNKFVEGKKATQQWEEKFNSTRAKYIKAKQASKLYENQLKYIEEKVKLYENERLIDERETLLLRQQSQQQKQTQQGKVKALDEIQNMIRQHRKNLGE